jgi:hypothetical protein
MKAAVWMWVTMKTLLKWVERAPGKTTTAAVAQASVSVSASVLELELVLVSALAKEQIHHQ